MSSNSLGQVTGDASFSSLVVTNTATIRNIVARTVETVLLDGDTATGGGEEGPPGPAGPAGPAGANGTLLGSTQIVSSNVNVTVPYNIGVTAEIEFETTAFQVGSGIVPNLVNNLITVTDAGLYEIKIQGIVELVGATTSGQDAQIVLSTLDNVNYVFPYQQTSTNSHPLYYAITMELPAGEEISLTFSRNVTCTFENDRSLTRFTVSRLM